MHRFIEGEDRRQPALLPHCLEDYVDEENPVRVILSLSGLVDTFGKLREEREGVNGSGTGHIEPYYNRRRIHSAIGYITPEQAERKTE